MSEEGFGLRGERRAGGRYRLLGELGRGGMGVVWRAYDEALGREVAVKEVRAPAGLGGRDVDRLYARLEREGRAAARVSHRNVVSVYDVALEGGRPWLVMELVRGLSFADVLEAEGSVPPARAASVGAGVLAALRAAHAVGVLHRDVKPGNVLLGNDGRVVLSDFGIAMVEGDAALTLTGELIGSPEFLAPERALGQPPGPEADLWSLGVMLYAAVEGFSPFRQDTPLSTLRAVVDAALPPPRWAGPLRPVLEGLLHKEPRRRTTAPEAERLLRLVAAGGTPEDVRPRPGTPPATPTRLLVATAPPPSGHPTAPRPVGPADDQPPPQHPRRAVAALVAGALLGGLALGGLTWALLNEGGQDDNNGGIGGSTTATAATSAHRTDTAKDSARPASTAPALTITVVIKAERDEYEGACPPPSDKAPSFTATLSVDHAPATVDYRWITGSGRVSDGGWKSAHFGKGDSAARTVHHTEPSYQAGGRHKDWIAVETRGPKSVTSSRVGFATTCEEAPTDGASSDAQDQAAEVNTGR